MRQVFPKPLKLPVLSFMEKDVEGQSNWYDLNKGQFLQRIYVVTIEPEMEDANIHSRWPRLVQNGQRGLRKQTV